MKRILAEHLKSLRSPKTQVLDGSLGSAADQAGKMITIENSSRSAD
jgi:hypothetical protein